MQIKNQKAPVEKGSVAYTPDGKKIVMVINTADLLKDKGLNYFALKTGANAYFFDDPVGRKHNCVIVKYGKNDYKILTIPQLLIHLIYWRANVVFDIKIDKDFIWDLEKPDSGIFSALIENTTKILVEKQERATPQICNCIAEIKEDLSFLSQNYASVECNTISLYNIIEFKNRNKKFNQLLNTKLTKEKTIKETENIMKECDAQLKDCIKDDAKSCLYPYVRSGRVKSAQLTKVLCAVGTRPDIDKTILPWPVERGYIHGLKDSAEFFSETITARNALMTKNDSLPRSGLLSREINRLTSAVNINYNIDDCGNKRYLNYFVENEDYISMVVNKYYFDEDKNEEILITKENGAKLVGKTIKLRSFITCNCKDGTICKKCAGKVHVRLHGTRIGTLPSIKSINPLSQKALSAKHDLGTKSIAITNEALDKYFYSDGMDFFIKPEYANSRNLSIVVSSEDIEDLVNSSIDLDDESIDTTITLSYVAVRDHDVDYPIENDGMRIALTDAVLGNKSAFVDDEESDYTIIPINRLEEDQPVFQAILDTEEISKYLNALIGTIDRLSISKIGTYDELMDKLNKIIYTSGFVNNIIHSECIIYSMVRDANDLRKRPDWTQPDVAYRILKVSTAIEQKDMYTALAYQGLRRLFKTLSIRQRYGNSLYDPFFQISKSMSEV